MIQNPSSEIMLAGDWHGDFGQAKSVVMSASAKNIDTIVHLGDFGIWQGDKKYLNKLDALLVEKNIQLYFVDGNHENFDMLYAKPIKEDGTRRVRDNIHHLPRGFRWQWHGVSFLALGGAASIDRKYRTQGRDWWPEEEIGEEDIEKSIEGGPVDIMICHDSPANAPNYIVDDSSGQLDAMRRFGRENVKNCTNHRKKLQLVTDMVKPKLLFHGHYHRLMTGTYRHLEGGVGQVVGLDEGRGAFTSHTFVLNFDEAKGWIEELDTME